MCCLLSLFYMLFVFILAFFAGVPYIHYLSHFIWLPFGFCYLCIVHFLWPDRSFPLISPGFFFMGSLHGTVWPILALCHWIPSTNQQDSLCLCHFLHFSPKSPLTFSWSCSIFFHHSAYLGSYCLHQPFAPNTEITCIWGDFCIWYTEITCILSLRVTRAVD